MVQQNYTDSKIYSESRIILWNPPFIEYWISQIFSRNWVFDWKKGERYVTYNSFENLTDGFKTLIKYLKLGLNILILTFLNYPKETEFGPIHSVNVTKSAGPVDLVTLTKGILNGNIQFLCSDS